MLNIYDYVATGLLIAGLLAALFHPAFYHNEVWLSYMLAGCFWLIVLLSVDFIGYANWVLSFSLLFIFQLGLGLYQLITGYINNDDLANTITGTLQHSGVYSCLLAILLIPAHVSFRRQWFPLFSMLVALLLCFTKSRVGISALVFINLVLYRHSIHAWIVKYIKVSMRIVMIIPAVVIILFFFYIKRMSTEGRWLIWKTAINNISKQDLLTGQGAGVFTARYPLWQAQFFATHPGTPTGFLSADWTFSAFNMYLEIFIETGIAGIAFLLVLLYGYWSQAFKARGDKQYVYILLPSIILFQALVYYAFYISLNLLLLSFVFATRRFALPAADKPFMAGGTKKLITPGFVKWTVPVLLAVLIISSLNSFRHTRAVYQWQQLSKDSIVKNEEKLTRIIQLRPLLKGNGKYLFDCGRLYFDNGQYGAAITLLEECKIKYCNQDLYPLLANACYRAKKPDQAEIYQVLLTHIIPARLTYRYNLFLLYLEQQKKDKANKTGNELLTLPVKIPGATVDNILYNVKQEMQKF